ncbi:MAG: hypothetical protein AABM67_20670 [Acidobacteriota bacterium]
MQPEISHRCKSCGASIREPVAMFCPECGQALTKSPPDSKQPKDEETSKSSVKGDEGAPRRAMLSESANAATNIFNTEDPPSAIGLLKTQNDSTENQPAAAVEPAQTEAVDRVMNSSAPAVSKHRTYDKAREGLHRASTATREALADNVKRVEKIRHVSTVMFEEASYDPSLRFVLVAVGLFVVFLVLLLLSKVMG